MRRKTRKAEPAGMERRQAARHAVERPCQLEPKAPLAEQLSGVTTNVSRSGMLVRFPGLAEAGWLPGIGEQVRVVLDLPPSASYAPRSLECVARVVRTEGPAEETPALALEVSRMHIREKEKKKGDRRSRDKTCRVQ
ncbi:MAG: PilZ domain-containing protein [Bryobacterales bacterium]|nr:PilZ domain-containing protein [Bryobacterales bacterium]